MVVHGMGQGEVGECTWRVQTAWPCLDFALARPWLVLGGFSKTLVGTGFSPPMQRWAKTQQSHVWQWSFFPVWTSGWQLRAVSFEALMDGHGLIHELQRMAARVLVWSLVAVNPHNVG